MSADNYIAIWKVKNKFYGYNLSASCDAPKRRPKYPAFIVDTIEEAIEAAQSEHTEYGYQFVNLK